LLGFPDHKWPDLKRYSEMTIKLGGGPRYMDNAGVEAAVQFFMDSAALFEEKKQCPMDDVMTVWTKSEVDGRPLTIEEVGSDCLLVLDGGAETTRTVIGRTILNFIAHPEQWTALKAGADIDTAVEEFIRYVTPIHNMCRVANRDYAIGGATVREGQQVVFIYPSANRDEEHFVDGDRFDIARTPNNHISFGFGTHFCLGASLARLEIKVFFEELRRRVQSMQLTAGTSPVDMPNAFVHGLESAHIDLTWE
jgi:cholest-4-en-3-one 26-monooxygenase